MQVWKRASFYAVSEWSSRFHLNLKILLGFSYRRFTVSATALCTSMCCVYRNIGLFADYMVALGSSVGYPQYVLNGFTAECCKTRIRISETLIITRTSSQCILHVSRTSLRQVETFKYLKAIVTNNGNQEADIEARIADVGTVMHQLPYLISRSREFDKEAKLAIFNSALVPSITFLCEC